MSDRAYYEGLLDNPNIGGLLKTIRFAEGTAGPDGYRTFFGGGKFDDFSRHPDVVISKSGYDSSAAGAYQFLTPTWNSIAGKLGLADFSPRNQDIAALGLVAGRGVNLDEVVKSGLSDSIIDRLAPEWASFPTRRTGTSYYGQGGKKFSELHDYFNRSRGPLVSVASGGQPQSAVATGTPSSSAAGGSISPLASPEPVAPIEIEPYKPSEIEIKLNAALAPAIQERLAELEQGFSKEKPGPLASFRDALLEQVKTGLGAQAPGAQRLAGSEAFTAPLQAAIPEVASAEGQPLSRVFRR